MDCTVKKKCSQNIVQDTKVGKKISARVIKHRLWHDVRKNKCWIKTNINYFNNLLIAFDQHRILAPVTVSTQQAVAVNINCATNTIIFMHQFYDKLQRSRNFCTKTTFRSLFLTSLLKKKCKKQPNNTIKPHCFIKSFVKHSQKNIHRRSSRHMWSTKKPHVFFFCNLFSAFLFILRSRRLSIGCNRSTALSVAVRVSLCQVVSSKTLEFFFRILRLIFVK